MSSIDIGIFAACLCLGGAAIGFYLSSILPEHHLKESSKDSVKMASGMIATLAALVLGLMVASAKNSFDTISAADTQSGAKIILLDRVLAQYGPETQAVREELKKSVSIQIDRLWPEHRGEVSGTAPLQEAGDLEQVQKLLSMVKPTTPDQQELLQQARQLISDLVQARWQLIEEAETTVPTAFYVVLFSWLTILFLTIGLFAPRNITVITAVVLAALSFSGAILLFDEMNSPLDGLIKVSSAPFDKALKHLGK